MRRFLPFLACFLLTCLTLRAQQAPSTAAFDAYCATFFKEIQDLSAAKEYRQILSRYPEWEAKYNALGPADKQLFRGALAGVDYNRACYYALLKDRPNAVLSFRHAVANGYKNYSHAKVDTDLDLIRNDKDFQQQMAAIREHGDFIYVLQQAKGYAPTEASKLPAFTYQSADEPHLAALRKTYKLDSIAGQGNEVARFINLLHWVHEQVPHDGNHENPPVRNAQDLLRVCRAEKRGLNCRGLATILNEAYLAMGYKARFVGCLPKDSTDYDSHVINAVYSTTQQKWLWMDPTNDAYVMNEQGQLLSIEEVRARLIDGRPLLVNPTANWNHKVSKTKEDYLYQYMAKNLYKLQCPLSSQYDLETRGPAKALQYVTLLPATVGAIKPAVKNTQDGATSYTLYNTSNAAAFWQKP
ncbi:TPR end-of-group domain-containing protein [Hymenobacter negativus]|uniref:Transglutaminase domain-containing protein n=1 Tax=Hymenobacter negativus TaxID=2795026 RepID=A0ABS3QAK5_9BACT|nr:transglutaminase domain-containing protein [Hymenobacter negativus]MBO2008280.1 transglutaminase domain-containing protein [Hymenobacter negativus]